MPTQEKIDMGDADLTKAEAARRSSMPRRRGLHGRLDGIRATRTGALTLKVVIGVDRKSVV